MNKQSILYSLLVTILINALIVSSLAGFGKAYRANELNGNDRHSLSLTNAGDRLNNKISIKPILTDTRNRGPNSSVSPDRHNVKLHNLRALSRALQLSTNLPLADRAKLRFHQKNINNLMRQLREVELRLSLLMAICL